MITIIIRTCLRRLVSSVSVAGLLASSVAVPAAASAPNLLPHGAKSLVLFRSPPGPKRIVTEATDPWLYGPGHTPVWNEAGGVLLSQARRALPGSPWIFIPGRYGYIAAYPTGAFIGGAYGTAFIGGGGGTMAHCQRNEPFDATKCLDPDGGYVEFFKFAPDNVTSAVIAGQCWRSVHGVLLGRTTVDNLARVFESFTAITRRWRLHPLRRQRCDDAIRWTRRIHAPDPQGPG